MTGKEIHEGIIEHMVACYDPDDSEYLASLPVEEPDLKQHNLKEGDKIRYTIDNQGYAVILGKIHIKKNIIPVKN